MLQFVRIAVKTDIRPFYRPAFGDNGMDTLLFAGCFTNGIRIVTLIGNQTTCLSNRLNQNDAGIWGNVTAMLLHSVLPLHNLLKLRNYFGIFPCFIELGTRPNK
ncbi:hypothetical protein H3L98_04325 [Conchiformibius steedae]|nr:hypothetical protein H3L98_04325 [Conchiformibius steedae]